MRFLDVISILVSLAGIVVTLYSLYIGNSQIKDVSSFYEYRLISEKNVMKNLKRGRTAKKLIFYSFPFITNIESSFNLTGLMSKEFLNYCKKVNSLIVLIFISVYFVCIQFVVFTDFKWINSLIERKRVRKNCIMEKRNNLFMYYLLITMIVGVRCLIVNKNMLGHCVYLAILVWIGIDALYSIFMFRYMNLRLQFHVSKINVKVKHNSKPYVEVYNYSIQNGQLAVMVETCGMLKKYLFPESELEYIEKIIDEKKTLLNTEYKVWIIERKKCNSLSM